jgi:transposase InsO family protein
MRAHAQRQAIPVARCTAERLMRANGWQGVTRARKVRTTLADPGRPREHRIWSTECSPRRGRVSCMSPTSPMCRW